MGQGAMGIRVTPLPQMVKQDVVLCPSLSILLCVILHSKIKLHTYTSDNIFQDRSAIWWGT